MSKWPVSARNVIFSRLLKSRSFVLTGVRKQKGKEAAYVRCSECAARQLPLECAFLLARGGIQAETGWHAHTCTLVILKYV